MSDEEQTKRGLLTKENLDELFEEELEGWDKCDMYVKTIYPVRDEKVELELRGVWLQFIKINDNMEKLKSLGFREGSHDAEMVLHTKVNRLPDRVFE